MSEYRRYDEVNVGDIYPPEPLMFRIDADVVDTFLEATGDGNGLYGAVGTARRSPSMIAAVYLIDLLKARRSPPGGIHAKQSVRFHRAVTVGETLSVQARVVDKYVRKERPYVVSEFEARDGDGSCVATGRITSIWGRDS